MSPEKSFNPARKLCPDGACIGVIGDDGRCPACGRTGGPPLAAQPDPAPPSAPRDVRPMTAATSTAVPAAEATGGFNPNRRLCPDGTCLGVIAENGLCPVCGARGEASV